MFPISGSLFAFFELKTGVHLSMFDFTLDMSHTLKTFVISWFILGGHTIS